MLVSWMLCCYCGILIIFFSLKYRNSDIHLLLLCEEEMLQGHVLCFTVHFLLPLSVRLSGGFFYLFFCDCPTPNSSKLNRERGCEADS